MNNNNKITALTALAILMGIIMIAGLLLCNIYMIAISEMLALVIIGMRFLLTNKTQEI
jgi:hypothetical protein